jgi:hypothetical protein
MLGICSKQQKFAGMMLGICSKQQNLYSGGEVNTNAIVTRTYF